MRTLRALCRLSLITACFGLTCSQVMRAQNDGGFFFPTDGGGQRDGPERITNPQIEQRLEAFRERYEANKQAREPVVVPEPPAKEAAVEKERQTTVIGDLILPPRNVSHS